MKNKKLNKIISKAVSIALESFKKELNTPQEVKSSYNDDYNYVEYNLENSKRFTLMLNNMLNYTENLNIRVLKDTIYITSSDFTEIKKANNNTPNNQSMPYNESNYLEIEINRIGFLISLGYQKRTTCSDESIFDTFLPIFKEKMISINKDNFDSLYNDIMVQSGMMRDTNLEGLIEDILTNS